MSTTTANELIVQTARELSVAGTRITLYDILDYVHAGWPTHHIAAWLKLSDEQVRAALDYIDAHRTEVECQYQDVLRQAESHRAYWEGRNRGRRAKLEARAATDDILKIKARIRQRREKLGQ